MTCDVLFPGYGFRHNERTSRKDEGVWPLTIFPERHHIAACVFLVKLFSYPPPLSQSQSQSQSLSTGLHVLWSPWLLASWTTKRVPGPTKQLSSVIEGLGFGASYSLHQREPPFSIPWRFLFCLFFLLAFVVRVTTCGDEFALESTVEFPRETTWDKDTTAASENHASSPRNLEFRCR